MTTEQSVLLKLIRQSQFDTVEDIAWDEIDLDALYEEASQQAVLGLIAPLIPEAYSNDTWRKAQLQQEASYIRYCFAQDELKKVLDDANIPFVILKGNAAAIYYKEPMRRAMGDIDFLVPYNQFDEAKRVLCAAGYSVDHFDGRHITYLKNGVSFELHRYFSTDESLEEYLTNFQNHPAVSIDNHSFPMPAKLVNGLVLLDHMKRHLKAGLGLRQLVDWMMYVYNNPDDCFWNDEFLPIVQKDNMSTLAVVATRTCQIHLGLSDSFSWCKSADINTCEQMIHCLLTSGNFGHKNKKGNSIETVTTNIKQMGMFKWLQYAGESNWKSYKKHHWLKPFCWLYQIMKYTKLILPL